MKLTKTVLAIGLALGASMPSLAADSPPLSLAPAEAWHLHQGPDSCSLIRRYGKGADSVIMAMEQFQPGDFFRLTLAGKSVFTYDEKHPVRIQFGPDEEWQTVPHFRGFTKDKVPTTIVGLAIGLAAPEKAVLPNNAHSSPARIAMTPERERRITQLSFDGGRTPVKIVVLELGAMDAPMAALRECMNDVLSQWGLNPQEQRTLRRRVRPETDPREWLNSANYPATAAFSGQRAIINFRLAVDTSGKATACHIQNAVGGPGFSEAVCSKIMQRASFEPALNAAGQPVASFYASTARFDFPLYMKK